jgi:hypothetical protein
MWFRLILQPLVALIFGVRAGLRNARLMPDGVRALDPAYRKAMFRQALHDVGKVAIVGFILDAVYQFVALRAFYPLEALVVAFLLVALPYEIVRTAVRMTATRR